MTTHVKPPSLLLAALEGRAIWELGAFYLSFPWLQATPRGDGHPVLVLPGFMATDASTVPLRTFLRTRGYPSTGWKMGRNYGRGIDPVNGIPEDAETLSLLAHLYNKYEQKVTLIGWSLGGIYAREIARMRPQQVRQVITMGSPFNGHPRANNVVPFFEAISGHKIRDINPELLAQMQTPTPVPSTAIYSKSDGVAAWQTCVEPEGHLTESVAVCSSHCGLGHHPAVLWIIADRLTQSPENWQPFAKKGLRSLVYG